MIDPANITNFNRTQDELEEFAIFAVLVAGKTAKTVARQLDKILAARWQISPCGNISPLDYLGIGNLENILLSNGIGCYRQKAAAIGELADRVRGFNLDLRTCTPEDLEQIKGIGLKTSRFFIMHSRANARIAALDTHILKGLRDNGVEGVPSSTPTNPKVYRMYEMLFLYLADKFGKTPAELDLEWWRHYSGNTVAV